MTATIANAVPSGEPVGPLHGSLAKRGCDEIPDGSLPENHSHEVR